MTDVQRAFLFAGTIYTDILTELNVEAGGKDKAVEASRELGYPHMNIVILKEQKGLLAKRYPGHYLRSLVSPQDALMWFLGSSLLYETSPTAYL